jgi:hypothetical protein
VYLCLRARIFSIFFRACAHVFFPFLVGQGPDVCVRVYTVNEPCESVSTGVMDRASMSQCFK